MTSEQTRRFRFSCRYDGWFTSCGRARRAVPRGRSSVRGGVERARVVEGESAARERAPNLAPTFRTTGLRPARRPVARRTRRKLDHQHPRGDERPPQCSTPARARARSRAPSAPRLNPAPRTPSAVVSRRMEEAEPSPTDVLLELQLRAAARGPPSESGHRPPTDVEDVAQGAVASPEHPSDCSESAGHPNPHSLAGRARRARAPPAPERFARPLPLPDHLHPQHLDHLRLARVPRASPDAFGSTRRRVDASDVASGVAATLRRSHTVPISSSTPSPSAHSAKRKPPPPPPPPPRRSQTRPDRRPRASSIDSAPPSPRGTDRAMMTRCTSRRDARDAPATAPVPCVDRRVPPRRYPDPDRKPTLTRASSSPRGNNPVGVPSVAVRAPSGWFRGDVRGVRGGDGGGGARRRRTRRASSSLRVPRRDSTRVDDAMGGASVGRGERRTGLSG